MSTVVPVFFWKVIWMSADYFGRRLRELREAAGLTQQELANRAGIKLGGVRDLEQSRNNPTWPTVLALCNALGVKCEAFTQEPTADAEPPKRGRPRKPPEPPEAT